MKSKQLNLGLSTCLVILMLWATFLVAKKPNSAHNVIQKVATTQSAITQPVVDAVKPDTAQAAVPAGKNLHVPVLMYHHVGPLINNDATELDLTVSAANFESQVIYFKNLGYQSVSVAEVYAALESGGALPAKPIVFTFDDGYKDVFSNAVPILQKYGFTGSFAIATELLGRPDYAVWADVIAAHAAGMEILSHTENHLDLTSSVYSDADLRREIFDSKQMLEQKLGAPVEFFVYPYGKHNAKVESLVKDAGYKMAFTTAYGQYVYDATLYSEPRVRVHGQDGLDKLKKIFSPAPRTDTVLTNP